MAQGDVKPIKSNYRGGGYSGGGSTYDDEGRGMSKTVWEWFEMNFNAHNTLDWLLSLDNSRCYWLLKYSTQRFNLQDIAFIWSPGYNQYNDSRAHRLVVKELSEDAWLKFHAHMVAGYTAEKQRREQEQHEQAQKWAGEYAAYEAQRKAEAARIEREDRELVQPVVDLTAGMLTSELNQAIVPVDKNGLYAGEYIDEVVDVYMDGSGFGEVDKKAQGIKLQVTVSLDLTNSMYYNGINVVAANAYRDLALTLKALQAQYGDSLYVGLFTFGQDYNDDAGKFAKPLTWTAWDDKREPDSFFKELEPFKPSSINRWYKNGDFDGTDTWIYPLFEEIERWEKEHSDPTAVRLDLIITDAVLEHPTDIRKADVIQERRNGALQSVMLNFMPERDWLGSTLPKRTFMMKVEKDNISGILRNVLAEFVGAYL